MAISEGDSRHSSGQGIEVGAVESSPLVDDTESPASSTVGRLPGDEESLGSDGDVSTRSVAAEDEEMDRPWPATLERGISLLAGPSHLGDAAFVEAVTKSPRFGTPNLAARAKKSRKAGYYTPEQVVPPHAMPSSPWAGFKKGIAKYHSLDFKSSQRPAASGKSQDDDQEEGKPVDPHAYRLKVLAEAKKKAKAAPKRSDSEEAMLSPGYHRERETERFRRQEKKEAEAKAKTAGRDATFAQCCFNMSNILMGVGMLGLPYVFKSAGWVGGSFVTFFFAGVTWRTSILIGRELNGDPRPGHAFDDNPYKSPTVPGSSAAARMRKPISTFPDIAREAFGDNGCIVLSSVLYFELFSCLAIFFVSLGDHLHTLFPQVSESKHMVIVAIVLTLPTALLRTPKLLSYLSAVGTFATVAVVLSVVLSAIYAGDITDMLAERSGSAVGSDSEEPHHIVWRTSGLPLALGLIAYTFSGHAIVPSIYSSMERPQDFEKMIDATFLVVVSCCLLVAVSGYYMFGTYVEDQITISLATAGTSPQFAMDMLTWLMILTAFSKFTLTMFPLALGIEEIVAPYVPTEKVMEAASSLIKLALIVLALAVAIFFPSFSFLCSLVGLVCTMIVSAIFPAAAHLKLFGDHLKPWEKILDWMFVIGGTVMAVVGTIATV